MARGFESKSVEEQQAEAKRESTPGERLSSEQAEDRRKREGLLLSRKSILARLESVANAAHRKMLESALKELDRQIAELS